MPPFGNTLNALSIHKDKKFVDDVDNITENAPFVKAMPFMASTDQLWDMASELRMVSGAQRVDLNAPLPTVEATSGLIQTHLAMFGGTMFVPRDTALLEGGAAAYFSKYDKVFGREMGMRMESFFLYDAILQAALQWHKEGHGNVIDAGGSNNANYSIIVVRFDDITTSGLFSPLAFKSDTFLTRTPLNGGDKYVNYDAGSKYYKSSGFGLELQSWCGIRLLSWKNVGAVVNIDLTTATPITRMMVEEALLAARSEEAGKCVMVFHPKVRPYLEQVGKVNPLSTEYGQKAADFRLESWNGVPFVTTYNMLDGAEANVSL